jgi:hypothetical protein
MSAAQNKKSLLAQTAKRSSRRARSFATSAARKFKSNLAFPSSLRRFEMLKQL